MRDLADYINLGDNTYVNSTTTTTKPSGPSGQVIYVPRPVPISQVPEASRPLIVMYDVSAVLNAPCPWSAANKAKCDELLASPYVTAQQKVQLRSEANKCVAQAKPVYRPPTQTQTPTMTWTPPTWDFSAVAKPGVKPSAPAPTQVQTLLPPPSPAPSPKPTITTPTSTVLRPILDLDYSATIEELERQRVARQEQQKKDLEELRAEVNVAKDKYGVLLPPPKFLDVPLPASTEQKETFEPSVIAGKKEPKVPAKPLPSTFVSSQKIVVAKKVESPSWWKELSGVATEVFKAGQGAVKQNVMEEVDYFRKSLDEQIEKATRSEVDKGKKKLAKGAKEAVKALKDFLFKKTGMPSTFSVGDEIKFSDFEELNSKADRKLRDARNLSHWLTLAAAGVDVLPVDALVNSAIEKIQNQPEARDLRKNFSDAEIGQAIREVISQFQSKYSSSRIGAAIEGVINPTKTESQQLYAAKHELGPFYNQMMNDLERFAVNAGDLLVEGKAYSNPQTALLSNERSRLEQQLANLNNTYERVKNSDWSMASGVKTDIKITEKKIKGIEDKLVDIVTEQLMAKAY